MKRLKYNILEFVVVVIVGLGIYCVNIYTVANNTTYQYAIELWNYGREGLHVLYPFLFSAPFCWLLFYEKNGSFWKSVYNRTILKKYVHKRIITTIFLSAAAMLIVSFISLLFAYLVAPMESVKDFEPIMTNKFYGAYQISHPVLYGLILSCWRSVLAALYTAFAIAITMISKNIFIAMTGAFIYSILENFISAILHLSELSICTSFYPNRLNSSVITIPKLLAGPFILIVITIILYFYYCKKEKYTLMD